MGETRKKGHRAGVRLVCNLNLVTLSGVNVCFLWSVLCILGQSPSHSGSIQ